MLMLPKRIPLQIYVQETLQKSARSFTVHLLVGAACLVLTHISSLKLLLCMVVSIRRRLMIILIVWQLVDKLIKVINKSDDTIEPRCQPILPTTEKHKSSPSVNASADSRSYNSGWAGTERQLGTDAGEIAAGWAGILDGRLLYDQ